MDIYQPINVTAASRVLTRNDSGGVITVNRAAGSTLTLPASSGSGMRFQIFLGTTVTSNSAIVQVANSTDIMSGLALQAQDAGSTVNAWETGATDDTITLNGTTSGGIKGDFIELVDVSSGIWWVRYTGSATGTEVTPFSSAV
jgi:hypothetical protein